MENITKYQLCKFFNFIVLYFSAWLIMSNMTIVADTHYVDIKSSNPAYPYTNWNIAATTIQDAVDVASDGDTVLVSNGIYNVGATRMVHLCVSSNRVVINNDISVISVNGPSVSIIEGAESTDADGGIGTNAIRCVFMSDGLLSGFTLSNGHTVEDGHYDYDMSGGGVFVDPNKDGYVSNCVIIDNRAVYGGGSAYGRLENCKIISNYALGGGGCYSGYLKNCLLKSNRAYFGGGCASAIIQNSELKMNLACFGGGAAGKRLINCSLTENSAFFGGGGYESDFINCTITKNSALFGGGYHDKIEFGRFCGNGRTDYGRLLECIIYNNEALQYPNYHNPKEISYCCTYPMPIFGDSNITNNPLLVDSTHIQYDSPCVGRGTGWYSYEDIDGDPWRAPASIGCDEPYDLHDEGLLIVKLNTLRTISPNYELFLSSEIEGKVKSLCWDYGDGCLVTNSSFETKHSWSKSGIYCVKLTAYNENNLKGVSSTVNINVQNNDYYVNVSNKTPKSPYTSWTTAATNIQDAVNIAHNGSVVWVSNGVYDVGSTITPGYLSSNRLVITNDITVKSINGPEVTIIKGAKSADSDEGLGINAIRCVYMSSGELSGFTITNGHTHTLNHYNIFDVIGGGINMYGGNAVVRNCIIVGNSAWYGGGTIGGILYNCLIVRNISEEGGGSFGGVLNNCTIVKNTARTLGGGVSLGNMINCIVYTNINGNYSSRTFETEGFFNMSYCCTDPMPISGTGNITNDPIFVNSLDLRLAANSSCINAGQYNDWMINATDFSGSPRILLGSVDIGAYEFVFKANLKVLLEGGVEGGTGNDE